MLIQSLEHMDEGASPAFKNVSACKKWLKQLQFTNLSATQALLREQLAEFDRYPVRSLERLQVLELLRETVHELQEDCARKIADRPLPLTDAELTTLASLTGLWQSMAVGYSRCLKAYDEGDKQLKPLGALLCHRCLMYGGRQIFEYLRAGYEFDGDQWRQFHSIYLFAEEKGLLSEKVEDEFSDHGRLTTCRFIYLKILFSCHARVQELSAHQQELLDRWLVLWMDTPTIERTCAVSRGDAPPLAIDPGSSAGLQPLRQDLLNNPNVRYIPMVPMSKLLRVKTILLQQGQTPALLGLGDAGDRLDCIALLNHLHRQWCEPRPQRVAERQGSTQEMLLRYGLEDIYSWMAPQSFDRQRMAYEVPQELWRAEDLSILGARLMRVNKTGARIGINRIVAVQIANAWQIASTVWVSVTRTGDLHMGIRFLPGTATPVIVRSSVKPGEPPAKPAPGLLLSAVPNLGIPPSLLLPRNLYQLDRAAELATPAGEKQRIKLKYSVEVGGDYERVSFLAE
ncbi:MAG TPA: hypothetical protein VIU46_08660 [Gallionellaceae bacterium]